MSIEFLATLRDAAQQIVDACQKELELSNPDKHYNPEKLYWIKETGKNGVYERYPAYKQKATPTEDYLKLVQDLKEHERYFVKSGIKYWLFDDLETVGRKPAI